MTSWALAEEGGGQAPRVKILAPLSILSYST